MYRKEKLLLTSLITNMMIIGVYCLIVYFKHMADNPEILNDFKFLGKAFLRLIPFLIGGQIIIHIIFAIVNKIVTNENMPSITDERDKLIELRATKISHWIYGLGFLLAMGSQAIGMQPWVLVITLFGSCWFSSFVSEASKIIMYRKGF